MNHIAKRSKQLFQGIAADAVLLKTNECFPDSSISYFTGLQKPFLSSHLLVLRKGRQPLLLKSVLEPKIAVPGLNVKRIDRRKQFADALKLAVRGAKAIGLNKPLYSMASFGQLMLLKSSETVTV